MLSQHMSAAPLAGCTTVVHIKMYTHVAETIVKAIKVRYVNRYVPRHAFHFTVINDEYALKNYEFHSDLYWW